MLKVRTAEHYTGAAARSCLSGQENDFINCVRYTRVCKCVIESRNYNLQGVSHGWWALWLKLLSVHGFFIESRISTSYISSIKLAML